jgi:hypothetical protein
VNGLEQQLQALGLQVAYPSEPDLAPAVLARLEPRRPFPWRRAVAVALAAVVIGVATAFAVPGARSAILHWFHLRGVTVERVETLPSAVERSQAAGLGRPVSRAEAERELGFRLVLPPLAGGEPRQVYVLDGALASVIVRDHGRPLLLSQFQATTFGLLKKLVGSHAVVEPVQVNGSDGLWIEGPPHTLTYLDRQGEFRERTVRIRGNVLLWTRGDLTLRLEGQRLSKADALRIARELH